MPIKIIVKIKFEQIETEMLESLKAQAADNYGIEIKVVGIKQLGVSEKITKDVFDRMIADRTRKKEQILAAGDAEALRITSDAKNILERPLVR